MSLSVRWHRLDAARWVHRLLVLQALQFGLLAVVALFAGLAAGTVWLVLVPLALTALAGWLAHAWDLEQRWTWWAAMAGVVLSAGFDLLELAIGVSGGKVAVRLLGEALLVALLVHPDSTARLERRPVDSGRHGAGSGLGGRGRP